MVLDWGKNRKKPKQNHKKAKTSLSDKITLYFSLSHCCFTKFIINDKEYRTKIRGITVVFINMKKIIMSSALQSMHDLTYNNTRSSFHNVALSTN